MADTKITALTALTAADPSTDVLPIVDTSDTTMAASGTTKKISINNILGASGTATLASATISGAATVGTTLGVTGIATFAAGTALLPALTTTGDTNTGIYYPAADTFAVTAGGSERFRIDSSGNVGIGVTPSAWSGITALQVSRGSFAADTGSYTLSQNVYNNGGNKYIASAAALQFQAIPGTGFLWYTAPSGTAGNAITFTQAMTLDGNGNLLVGTTSAGGNRLNVQTASGDCLMLLKAQAANTNFVIDYVSNYGNYTIRKSGAAVWDYGVISDSSVTPAFKIQNASSVGVQLVSGATAWTTLSDETVKDIIEPISNAVAKVGSIRSVIGKFKTDDSGKRRSFLIAQDVQSVLPEAVDVVGENNELGLRYTEVIPLLVAAIKELTARVQTLETR